MKWQYLHIEYNALTVYLNHFIDVWKQHVDKLLWGNTLIFQHRLMKQLLHYFEIPNMRSFRIEQFWNQKRILVVFKRQIANWLTENIHSYSTRQVSNNAFGIAILKAIFNLNWKLLNLFAADRLQKLSPLIAETQILCVESKHDTTRPPWLVFKIAAHFKQNGPKYSIPEKINPPSYSTEKQHNFELLSAMARAIWKVEGTHCEVDVDFTVGQETFH